MFTIGDRVRISPGIISSNTDTLRGKIGKVIKNHDWSVCVLFDNKEFWLKTYEVERVV